MSRPAWQNVVRVWLWRPVDLRSWALLPKKRQRARFILCWLALGLVLLLMASQPHPLRASDLTQVVQAVLDEAQHQYGFPGATAAYVLSDRTVGVVATGMADREAKTPMTVRSRMLAASIGKTFVGATAIALAQEGILDLDAPISQYVGEVPWFSRLPNHQNITLNYLLTHRSGLPDHVHLASFAAAVSRHWQDPGNPFPPESLIEFAWISLPYSSLEQAGPTPIPDIFWPD